MSYRSLVAWSTLVVAAILLCAGLALRTAGEIFPPAAQAQPADGDTQQVTVTRVVDGDTIEVSPAVDGREEVRLIGVDTPEVFGGEQLCGPEASVFTTEQIEGEDVTLEFDEDRVDPFDRALAYVWMPDLDGELFNETLVEEGLARVDTFPPNDKYEDRFLAAERQARDEGLGVWASDPCEDEGAPPEATTPETTTPPPQPAPRPAPRPAPDPEPAPAPPDLLMKCAKHGCRSAGEK